MIKKMFVSLACVWLMLSVFSCFADDGPAKDRSADLRSDIMCPSCGAVSRDECKMEKCDACKKSPDKLVHKGRCDFLRHKCGTAILKKLGPGELPPVSRMRIPIGSHGPNRICPKCGEVPSSECGIAYCSDCKKAPGQIMHIQSCQVLRHKCGNSVTSKRSPAKTTKPVNKAAEALPADFAISYEKQTAGVLPIVTYFMRISKTKEGAFFFVQGQRAWDGEKQKETVTYRYELTKAQCQKIYKSTQELGFFNLKDNYSADDGMTGGESKEVKVTANGKSKTVSTYEKSQASFDKLVAIIEEHSLINVLKSRK